MARRKRQRWHDDALHSAYGTALLEAAAELTRTRRTVVSYGLGFKFARDEGYGRRRIPCLKFYVRRKRGSPSAREAIPESVTVRVRGRTRRVRTDVEELRGSVTHANASCRIAVLEQGTWQPSSRVGSCGFFVRSQAHGERCWVVTAGHVVVRPGAAGASCDDRVSVDGQPNGAVACDASYFKDQNGWFYDVGAARVDADLVQLSSDPQSGLRETMPLARLVGAMEAHERLELEVHSYKRRFRVAFDSVMMAPVDLRPGNRLRTYGPTLVYTRSTGEDHYCRGDSGAPLISTDGRQLVGVHFMGTGGEAGGPGCRATGVALYAGTIKRLLEPALGALELALEA